MSPSFVLGLLLVGNCLGPGTGRDESTCPEPGPDDRKEVDSRQRSASLRIHTTGSGTGRKEVFYLTTHSTHFIYGYMASDIYGKEPLR